MIDLVFLVGWVVFWIYWLAVATGAKAGRTRWVRFAGVRAAVLLVVLLLVRLRTFRGSEASNHDLWLGAAGLGLFACGLALAVWARRYLGQNWGMPMSEKLDPELVTTGPYGRVRHPIYSGIILAMVGTAVAIGWYWLIAVAVLGSYFVYSAVMEERYMTDCFPDTYPAYKRSTKMLIPFVL